MYCKSCRWTLDLPPINPKCDTIKSKNNHTHRPLQKPLVFLYPIFANYIPQDALFKNVIDFLFLLPRGQVYAMTCSPSQSLKDGAST